jgi:hypothetical protein
MLGPGYATDMRLRWWLAAEDLELLATAAHLLGHIEDCLAALQRAERSYAAGGDPRRAARCAFWLTFHYGSRGDLAQASGLPCRPRTLSGCSTTWVSVVPTWRAYSWGGAIALELAAQHPTRVASLVLLEPAFLTTPAGSAFARLLASLLDRYAAGDAEGAVHGFLALVGDRNWRAAIEQTVPGGIDQAVKDAATFFETELPGAPSWSFGPEQAAAVTCPVLSVLGSHGSPLFVQSRQLLHAWFPACQDADIAGLAHLLQMQAPGPVAAAIAAFLIVIPPDCDLTVRNLGIPAWDDVDPALKPVLARQMEIGSDLGLSQRVARKGSTTGASCRLALTPSIGRPTRSSTCLRMSAASRPRV